jgi:hypothetical protein
MLGRRVKETMSAQVAALQALSEGLLTFLFPSQRKMRELLKRAYPQQDLWSSLLQDPLVCQELERLAQAIKELARPLAYAKDATELEHTINDQLLSAYLVWKGELFTLVLNKALLRLVQRHSWMSMRALYNKFNNFFKSKPHTISILRT